MVKLARQRVEKSVSDAYGGGREKACVTVGRRCWLQVLDQWGAVVIEDVGGRDAGSLLHVQGETLDLVAKGDLLERR